MIYDSHIDKLLENYDIPEKTIPMDLILDTGAFNGIYLYGSLMYIKKLESLKAVKIERISGASIGAICGMLYIFDKLDAIENFYRRIRETIRKEGTLNSYHDVLKEFFSGLDENEFKKLNDRLYINFQCTKTRKQIVVKTYESNDDVMDKLYKSSFLPLIMNGQLVTNGYIDGINPYIFEERSKDDKKILYLNLLSLDRIKTILNTKHDKNTSCKALKGILQTHEFFTLKTSNNLCSFVNDWKIDNLAMFRVREIFCFLVVSIISLIMTISDHVVYDITNIDFINTLYQLLCKLYKECLIYVMYEV